MINANWVKVCKVEDIAPYSGVSALVFGRQVAIFRLEDAYYGISDYDPFSGSYVLSRGFVDVKSGVPRVASPVYHQSFNLVTGECLTDPAIKLATYPIKIIGHFIHISVTVETESRYTFQTLTSRS